LIIPAPPGWLFWAIIIVAVMVLFVGCSYPLRTDPHRQDLEWKQKQCLDQGKSPPECRP